LIYPDFKHEKLKADRTAHLRIQSARSIGNYICHVLANLDDGGPLPYPLQPGTKIQKFRLQIHLIISNEPKCIIPRQKGSIRVAKPPTNQVLAIIKHLIQHSRHPKNLILVPFPRAWDLFRMPGPKPGGLAKVRTLSADLEVDPLFGMIVFGGAGGETNRFVLVVCLDEVFDDGT
ncbi:uncharacterized protein BO80DRAFT_178993, partial [Aspergillus ibericus CBS 121593]